MIKRFIFALFVIAPLAAVAADKPKAPSPIEVTDEASAQMSAVDKLAIRLVEVANDKSLSEVKKKKLIGTAVRSSFLTATQDIKDPDQILTMALEYGSVCTKTVPAYASVISAALISIPQVAAIADAEAQIKTTVEAASLSGEGVAVAAAAPGQIRAPAPSDFSGPVAPEVFVVSQASIPNTSTQTTSGSEATNSGTSVTTTSAKP